MLPLGLLNAAQGHPMLVELKNGETLNGHLVQCDTWMNLTLKEVVQTSPTEQEADKFVRLPEVYVKGNNIKYLRVPDEIIDLDTEAEGEGSVATTAVVAVTGAGAAGVDKVEAEDGVAAVLFERARTQVVISADHAPPKAAQILSNRPCDAPSSMLEAGTRVRNPAALSGSCEVRLRNIRQAGHFQGRRYNPSQTLLCQQTQRRLNSSATIVKRKPAESADAGLSHTALSRRQYLERADKRAPWLNKLLSVRPGAPPEQLDQFSTQHIYDGLKELQSMEGSYHSIVMLAEFLLSVRKEAPNALLYEALIRANVDPFRGSARVAKTLLQEMGDSGISTTPGIYNAILQVTAVHPDYVLRSKALLEMKHRWYTPTLDGSISILMGLLRDGQYELALESLEELSKSPVIVPPWLLSVFLIKFGELGFHAESLQLLQHAVKIHNPQRSLLAWTFLLDVYSRDNYYTGITYIWERMVMPGRLSPSDGVVLHVLNTASRQGDVGLATSAMELLTERGRRLGMHHYEPLIEANLKRGDLEKALTLVCLMGGEGLAVDASSTRAIVLKLQSSKADTDRALRILSELRAKRRVPIAAFNVVLEATISHRGFQAALDLYRSVRQISSDVPDLWTFHILLSQCKKETSLNFIIAEMESFFLKPNRTTYNRLIRITSRQRSYEAAFRYLKKLKELRGPSPNTATDASGSQNSLWMDRGTALELIKRCIQNHDLRAQALLEESRARGMDLDAELEEFVASCQGNLVTKHDDSGHATTNASEAASSAPAGGAPRALSAAA
ncbi:hypothetical protein Micbo1qcDRAFT_171689 [Microdochium bolleyi]|uniref:Sm domain-containing protein n=1 Tax=Microdochium bolleyi TaxID=196109 RepID=A0A136JDT6_9PEZI|nr:hypothetical protein Micbo1qcDRAFT_171689 [Microdochium bolleyi]